MAIGQSWNVRINGKNYTVATNLPAGDKKAYHVQEVPSHYDMDPRMERRVVYNSFTLGILKHRDEKSTDSGQSSFYSRQTRAAEGLWWGNGGDTRIQDRILAQRAVSSSQPIGSAPVSIKDASVYSFIACKQHFYVTNGYSSGVQQLVLSKDFSAINPAINITNAIAFNGKIYVASCQLTGGAPDFSKPQGYWLFDQTSQTTVWAQAPASPTYSGSDVGNAADFVVIRNQIWRAAGPNLYSWDGVAASWSTAYVVGDPTTNITALDVYRDALIVFKQDGLYTVDRTGNVFPIFPGFKTLGFNPRPLGQWRSSYFFASDPGMVWEMTGDQVQRIGFDYAEPYPMASGSLGIPNAIAVGLALPNFFLVGFNQYKNSSSNCYFLGWDGHAWNPFRWFNVGQASAVGITGGNTTPAAPVIQFGLTGVNAAYYISDPGLDPFLVTNYDTTQQDIYMPVDAGAIEDEDKVFESVNIVVDNGTQGTLKVAYAIDDNILGLSFTDMGAPVNGGSTSFQTWIPPMPLPSYKKLALKISIIPTASTISPIIRDIVLHYKQRGPQRRTWDITLDVEKNSIGVGGRIDVRSARIAIDDLNKTRSNRQAVPFQTLLGETTSVYVDEVGEELMILKGATEPSFLVTVKLVEAFTT